MKTMVEIDTKLGHIVHEIIELKKTMIQLRSQDGVRSEQAWADLLSLSEEITRLWKGGSAVDEIRAQREKG